MNLREFHTEDKAVQTKKLFSSTTGIVRSLRIASGHQLKEHVTTVPALLICITGEAVFENEKGISEMLRTGDFVNIEPDIKHWVTARENSQFVLIK